MDRVQKLRYRGFRVIATLWVLALTVSLLQLNDSREGEAGICKSRAYREGEAKLTARLDDGTFLGLMRRMPSGSGRPVLAAALSQSSPKGFAGSGDVDEAFEKGFWGMLSDFDAEAFVGRYGYIAAFVAMYLLGLGLTVTPCVYPVVPITVGYFGSQSAGRWRRQMGLAFVFGTGVAVSYAAVGTAAAMSGFF